MFLPSCLCSAPLSAAEYRHSPHLQAANAVGYGGSSYEEVLKSALVPKGKVDYFVELHIEQGPELEREALDIGIVTAIAAPAALKVEFHGDGGHAGAQLMPIRLVQLGRDGIGSVAKVGGIGACSADKDTKGAEEASRGHIFMLCLVLCSL